MNPKEQAQNILLEFGSKKLAKLHVKRVIEVLDSFGYIGAMYDDFETGDKVFTDNKDPQDYWNEVLKKIEL
jgi:hypothetical protein